MTRGHAKDYNFGNKNNWRRTIWNEVLRRTDGREKQEPVLYLAGSGDHDRHIAISKGVPSSNLIAIDRCDRNVATVRGNGHAAVGGDVYDVLRAWPKDRPVSALVLDFCGGLPAYNVMDRLEAMLLCLRPFHQTVVTMNFLRGRDGASEWREICGNVPAEEVAAMIARAPASSNPQVLTPRHRGFLFAMHHAFVLQFATCGFQADAMERWSRRDHGEFMRHLCYLLTFVQPVFYSYKSGPLVYDSVVMNGVGNYCEADPKRDRWLRGELQADQQTQRNLAAVLAVRTRRLQQHRAE